MTLGLLLTGAGSAQAEFTCPKVNAWDGGITNFRCTAGQVSEWRYTTGTVVADQDELPPARSPEEAVQAMHAHTSAINGCAYDAGARIDERVDPATFYGLSLTRTETWKGGGVCSSQWGLEWLYVIRGVRHLTCPPGYTKHTRSPPERACARYDPTAVLPPDAARSCPADGVFAGNPISPVEGEKRQQEDDFVDPGTAPLDFRRYFRRTATLDPGYPLRAMGAGWTHDHMARLVREDRLVRIHLPDGEEASFGLPPLGGEWRPHQRPDRLVPAGDGWDYLRGRDDTWFRFDALGQLVSRTARNGWRFDYQQDGLGRLRSVRNPFGRMLEFSYHADHTLAAVRLPDGSALHFAYQAGRLIGATQRDGSQRIYRYDDPNFPDQLTGLVDETGSQVASYSYDAQGRAQTSEQAGGAERYRIDYPAAGSTFGASITDPLGTVRSYSYAAAANQLIVSGSSRPAARGNPDAAQRQQDAATGLLLSETDFTGATTRYTWDTARRLPTQIVRDAGASAQTLRIVWHPRFALPVRVDETGRSAAMVYDERGNLLSLDITDTQGAPDPVRRWQWSYDDLGLPITQTDPAGASLRMDYDAVGNLVRQTDARGMATQFTYDASQRLVERLMPNGRRDRFGYDQRDRLRIHTINDQRPTEMVYLPNGRVASVVHPDGLRVNYRHDAAQRVVGWHNNRGESGAFELDGMGNRVGESIHDASGQLAWSTLRRIDALNRVSSQTWGGTSMVSFDFDANGAQVAAINGMSEATRWQRDGLRRVVAITDAAGARTGLDWTLLDEIRSVRDARGILTAYERSHGAITTEHSPDISTRHIQRDPLGRPIAHTDPLGHTTRIQRDTLGRPIRLSYADGRIADYKWDLGPHGKGQLAGFIDPSGSTQLTRDPFGRLIAKRQRIAAGLQQEIQLSYTRGGARASLRYPDGSTLGYRYDPTGQLIQLDWNGQPLLTQLRWTPLGQPAGWTWAFLPAHYPHPSQRSHDSAGRLVATEILRYTHDRAGRIATLEQTLFAPAPGPGAGLTTHTRRHQAHYGPLGRIAAFGSPDHRTTYAYDPNGNRIHSQRTLGAHPEASRTRHYHIDPQSNRLLGFTQHQGAATTQVHYTHDPAGNRLSDGLHHLHYDASGRLAAVTRGTGDTAPTTRYAHNALGQRVFKTEPLHPSPRGDTEPPDAFLQRLGAFFAKLLWKPDIADGERLGWGYLYDEDGSLLAETGTGGASSTGSTQYIYLPTAAGPLPAALSHNGQLYAIHTDHLHTPRLIVDAQGQPVWQWAFSAFGEQPPTTAQTRFADGASLPADFTGTREPPAQTPTVPRFSLRYPGQVFDEESGLFYNYFRTYDPRTGRYTQADPIGLDGGWNRFGYVNGDPLGYADPMGLQALPFPVPFPPLRGGPGTSNARGGYDPRTDTYTRSSPSLADRLSEWIFAKPPENAYDPNGPKAPGKPGESEGFKDPREGERWVRNPNPKGPRYGWESADGGVWCPTGPAGSPGSGTSGPAHGGSHWDVQYPGGGGYNIYPGGKRRDR